MQTHGIIVYTDSKDYKEVLPSRYRQNQSIAEDSIPFVLADLTGVTTLAEHSTRR